MTEPTPNPPSLSPPRGQRGMVMFMMILMMGLLSLLASAAALRTAMDVREGGAERLTRAAYRISETGTVSVLSLASQMQGGFADYIAAKTNQTLTMADVGEGVLSTAAKDSSFGLEMKSIGSLGLSTVVLDSDSAAAAGYDVGRFCFRTYRIVTTSQLGVPQPKTAQEMLVSGQAKLQASMTVGPMPCGQ